MFVNDDGKKCGLPLAAVDRDVRTMTRYDLMSYQCDLGHRSYFRQEPVERVSRRDRAKDG
jgi:hypothetical protein